MVKLKNTRNVDARQALAVDNAHLACKPPERARYRRSRKPPEELYMRHLVLSVLTRDTMEQASHPIRRRVDGECLNVCSLFDRG